MLGFPGNGTPMGYQGGMGGIPPSPMGNIVGLGRQGYNNTVPFSAFMNSPYYTNNFVYNNPYAAMQRQRAEEAARKEQSRKQGDMFKSITKQVHKALGDMDDQQLNDFVEEKYDYDKVITALTEKKEELDLYRKLGSLQPTPPNYAYLNRAANISKSYKDRFPDNMSLAEYLDKAGELYREALMDMNKRAQKDGKLKYDSGRFNNIVDMHRDASSYFNKILTGQQSSIDIGDLEIRLPDGESGDRLSIVPTMPSKLQEYAERKRQFLEACLNSRGGSV